jgi:RNA polymerase sigma factor (sigma-70 family)
LPASLAIDEKDLLERLRDGDERAFNALYDKYKIKIATRLFAVLKSDVLVEDTLQELFFRVWDNRGNIDPDQAFGGYLYRIATNLALDHFRKIAREKRMTSVIEMSHNSLDDTYYEKLDESLYSLIEQLPPQRKKVFLLCKFENKSYEEVSQLLGISVHAVKDHVVKSNKFLKNNYDKLAPYAGYYIAFYALTELM